MDTRILMQADRRLSVIGECRSSGFTLLEVMVALAIIATVLVSVYQLHAQSLSLANETRFNGIAPFLAQQKMSEMTNGQAELPEDAAGDFGENFSDYRWKVGVEPLASGFDEKEAIVFVRIDLIVFNQTNPFSYRLRTYRLVPF